VIELVLFVAYAAATVFGVFLSFNLFTKVKAQFSAAVVSVLVVLGIYDAISGLPEWFHNIFWAILAIKLVIALVPPVRKTVFMKPMLAYFRKVLPPMSETEAAALEAGTVWWERELFSGKPNWNELREAEGAKLSDEEQAFLDGPVEELCAMVDDWQVADELKDLPPEAWQFLRDKGFFGMVLPKEYGGLEFSAYAHSCVVQKVASRSGTLGVTTMVPNSLGPGMLLHEYGTQAQKDRYLGALATGKEIPCFALTEPEAGSDAAGMTSHGIVTKRMVNGKEEVGILLNWNKRYITLAPVATLLGLAFKLYDPEKILGDKEDIGFTVALIPADREGVQIGERHMPLNVPFMNGPIRGKEVFITMEDIIGGEKQLGNGWRMLMECLSDGRGISLPSLSSAAGKFCCMHTGAYARIRAQFGVSIGEFEGVQEALGLIAGNTYLMDAVRTMTATSIDAGEKPSVASAIAKYHLTERMRKTINAAVDVQGGSAICMGPKNPLGRSYQAIPISITVEGANILTRSLIIFGQGSVRSHPWILKEMEAAKAPDGKESLADFDHAISNHALMFITNLSNSFLGSLSKSLFVSAPVASPAQNHYQNLTHLSARFGLMADLMMLRFGGDLKRLEFYSCLLGDLLSSLYMASAVLKHYQSRGEPVDDLDLLNWAMEDCYRMFHDAMRTILGNKPLGAATGALKTALYPFGIPSIARDRKLEGRLADLITHASETRDQLISGIYQPTAEGDHVAHMEKTFHQVLAAADIERKFRKVRRTLDAWDVDFPGAVQEAVSKGLITEIEASTLKEVQAARYEAIQVDEFDHDHWAKSSLSSGAASDDTVRNGEAA
jgi:acyl-CoA dehydrogenase